MGSVPSVAYLQYVIDACEQFGTKLIFKSTQAREGGFETSFRFVESLELDTYYHQGKR